MTAARLTTLALLAATAGCVPELKPGTDRADSSAAPPRDAPADVAPALTQRSCPDTGERGCGMVVIRGGTFTMGVTDRSGAQDGTPSQPGITVGDFALDVHEVTVARFRRYWTMRVASGDPRAVAYPGATLPVAAGATEPDATAFDPACNWSPDPGAREHHPINCADWYTAQAFCVWDGGRLPTEAEWEYVARGRAVGGLLPGRHYPWGDAEPSSTCDRARWNRDACPGDDGARTRRVGSFPRTPDGDDTGLYDLAGNVYEWVADNFAVYDDSDGSGCWGARAGGRTDPLCNVAPTGARALRGGSWFFDTTLRLRGASRLGLEMTRAFPLYGVGIRCARSR